MENDNHDEGCEEEENVRVCVRIRPLVSRELQENQTIGWEYNDTCLLESTANGQKVCASPTAFLSTAINYLRCTHTMRCLDLSPSTFKCIMLSQSLLFSRQWKDTTALYSLTGKQDRVRSRILEPLQSFT